MKFPCNPFLVPQISSKPSPSKRRCSEENQLALDEENQVPVMTRAGGPVPSDPLTDKKPPVGPASICSSSSLEQSSTRPVQSQPKELKAAQPENMTVTLGPDPPSTSEAPTEPPGSGQPRNKPDQVEDPTLSAAGMKSRLQRLVQQRKCWDGDDGKRVWLRFVTLMAGSKSGTSLTLLLLLQTLLTQCQTEPPQPCQRD